MKQIFLLILSFVLLGVGCNPSPAVKLVDDVPSQESVVEKFLPSTAQDVKSLELDFNGDGQTEKVISYTAQDVVAENQSVKTQHLLVLERKDKNWQIAAQTIYRNEDYATGPKERYIAIFLVKMEPVDLTNGDGNHQLLLTIAPERGARWYEILVYNKGGYEFLHSEKYLELENIDGHTNDDLELRLGESESYIELAPVKQGLQETVKFFCAKDIEQKPESNKYELGPCRAVSFLLNYKDGNLYRK